VLVTADKVDETNNRASARWCYSPETAASRRSSRLQRWLVNCKCW